MTMYFGICVGTLEGTREHRAHNVAKAALLASGSASGIQLAAPFIIYQVTLVCGRWLGPLLIAGTDAMTITGGVESFKQHDLARAGARSRFCDALKRDHAVIVELAVCNREPIANMWTFAAKFFALPATRKNSLGPLGEPEFSEEHLGQPRLLGFTQLSANDCLDTRLRRRPSDAAVRGGLEVLPRELEAILPGATSVLVDAQRVLFELGMTALRVVTDGLDSPLAQLEMTAETICCSSSSLPEGATSATVHRLVCYAASGRDDEWVTQSDLNATKCSASISGLSESVLGAIPVLGAVLVGNDLPESLRAEQTPCPTLEALRSADLAFPAHTDGTWFTIIPCAAQPGLEVRAASGWVSLEARGRHGIDVAVLTGQFLQSLSKFEYTAASHRVVRPQLGDTERLSAPLLMRAAPFYRERCKRADTARRAGGSKTRQGPQALDAVDVRLKSLSNNEL